MKFIDYLNNSKVKLLDGSMGAMLEKLGGYGGGEDNLYNPEKVTVLHKQYIEAGSEMIITNTLTMNRIYLKNKKKKIDVKKVNDSAVELARKAAQGKKVFILGNISSTGKLIEPYGKLTEMQAIINFKEQAEYLSGGNVDAFIIETMFDVREAIYAVKACKEVSDIPILALMSFETVARGGRTIMGNSAGTCAEKLQDAGIDVIGSNCGSLDPFDMSEIVKIYREQTDLPIVIEPNAGKPELINGNTQHNMSCKEFTEGIAKCIDEGATLVGGCCGTTPGHIKYLKEYLKRMR
ncbi:MAG: homocysteine S-methyltransferase family protein [Actinomycetia bacterium]|nr:homocysteine S-methyltransferase family protein [Actinomycetes bacterium]